MYLVALTGGISTGKSIVSGYFADLEVPIIDADAIAHQIVEPGQGAYDAVVRALGQDILEESGHINRPRLRQLAFENPEVLKQLEEILHPKIREEISSQIQSCLAPYSILAIPLLIEKGSFLNADCILVTDCDPQTQIERTIKRDACTLETVERIMQKQASREERLAKADDIINTDCQKSEVLKRVNDLHQVYLSRAAGA